MALDLKAIREAICDQIRPTLTSPCNLYPYRPLSPVFPCLWIQGAADYVSYHETFDSSAGVGGAADVFMDIMIAEDTEPEQSGPFVDSMLSVGSGNSVIEAIEEDTTLGGTVQSCICLTGQIRVTGAENVFQTMGIIRLRIVLHK